MLLVLLAPTTRPSRSATSSLPQARSASSQRLARWCVSRRICPAVESYILTSAQVEGGVEAQAEQALKNMKAVVEAGGSEVGKIVKTTVRASVLVIVP